MRGNTSPKVEVVKLEPGSQSFFQFWDRIKLLDVDKFIFKA